MKRLIGWALMCLGSVYALFCVVLIFVGSFTTTTVFPHDHGGNKAMGFGFFSAIILVALFLTGACLLDSAAADDRAKARLSK